MASPGIPFPPDVAAQMPDMGQFSGQASKAFNGPPQGAPGQPAPAADPMADSGAFATNALNQIADQLGKVAQVILQTRPELAPIIQKMAEAGSMLQEQLNAKQTPDDAAGVQSPSEPQGPQDVPMA